MRWFGVGDHLGVEAVVVDAERRELLVRRRRLDARRVGRRPAGLVDVDVTRVERLLGSRSLGDDLHLDRVELHARRVVVVGVLHERQRRVVLPRLQRERAVAHVVARIRPLVAPLRHRGLVRRDERRVRQLLDEPRLRRGQLDLDRRRVGRA